MTNITDLMQLCARDESTSLVFFVYSLYSYATYLDHDEYYVQSVSVLQSACSSTVQAPFCPPPRPIPQGAST